MYISKGRTVKVGIFTLSIVHSYQSKKINKNEMLDTIYKIQLYKTSIRILFIFFFFLAKHTHSIYIFKETFFLSNWDKILSRCLSASIKLKKYF